uniref:G-protein coupled receptors family 1 profile domain-containing protein n=1 Tax=Scleropages formosus TaxID=113540 RepID=A0A8C9S1B1_SCLFO
MDNNMNISHPTPNISSNSSQPPCPQYGMSHIFNWIIMCVGLPTIFLVGYALIRLVKADHVAPVYVINLLLSDLLQISTRPIFTLKHHGIKISTNLYVFAVLLLNTGFFASPFFMMGISLERYLVVAHPVWYRYRRNVRNSIIVSLIAWLIFLLFAIVVKFQLDKYLEKIYATVFLLPFPFLIFFNVGTIQGLSRTINLPSAEKGRILGTLFMVLGIYCILFLPYIFVNFFFKIPEFCYLHAVTFNIVDLNALVDPVLYIFMRKDMRGSYSNGHCQRCINGSGNLP